MWGTIGTLIRSLFKFSYKRKYDKLALESALSDFNVLDPIKNIWTYFKDSKDCQGLCCQASNNQVILSPVYGSVTQYSKDVVCIKTEGCEHYFSPGVALTEFVLFGQAFMQVKSNRPNLQLVFWTTNATCSLRSCLGKHLNELILDTTAKDDVLSLRYEVPHNHEVAWRTCYVDPPK